MGKVEWVGPKETLIKQGSTKKEKPVDQRLKTTNATAIKSIKGVPLSGTALYELGWPGTLQN